MAILLLINIKILPVLYHMGLLEIGLVFNSLYEEFIANLLTDHLTSYSFEVLIFFSIYLKPTLGYPTNIILPNIMYHFSFRNPSVLRTTKKAGFKDRASYGLPVSETWGP